MFPSIRNPEFSLNAYPPRCRGRPFIFVGFSMIVFTKIINSSTKFTQWDMFCIYVFSCIFQYFGPEPNLYCFYICVCIRPYGPQVPVCVVCHFVDIAVLSYCDAEWCEQYLVHEQHMSGRKSCPRPRDTNTLHGLDVRLNTWCWHPSKINIFYKY